MQDSEKKRDECSCFCLPPSLQKRNKLPLNHFAQTLANPPVLPVFSQILIVNNLKLNVYKGEYMSAHQ